MSAILKQKLIDIANGFTKYNLWKSDITVDSALNTTSTNPVQNKVITENINDLKSKCWTIVSTSLSVTTSMVGTVILAKPNDKAIIVSARVDNGNYWVRKYSDNTVGISDYNFVNANGMTFKLSVDWLVPI